MIGREIDHMKDCSDDRKWQYLLKQHDPVMPPTAIELILLEDRILAQIDARTEHSVPTGIMPATWMEDKKWILRSACFAAALFAVLGFMAGRSFDDLSFPAADQASLFASAGGLPWQSFITAPSSSGETDDTAE